MQIIGVILAAFFGVFFIAIAVAHEYTWWRRRMWSRRHGVVVGFTEGSGVEGGVVYYPEIEFQGPKATRRFVSTYGSGRLPTLGTRVLVLIDPQGDSGEQINLINRMLHTLFPLLLGLLCMSVACGMKPASQSPSSGECAHAARSTEL